MKCRICALNLETQAIVATESMYGYGDRFNYFLCKNCACLQIESYPSEMGKYYPLGYHSASGIKSFVRFSKSYLLSCRDRFELGSFNIFGWLLSIYLPSLGLKFLRPYILKKDIRILDVGCAEGQMLRSLSQLGYKNLTGVDPFCQNQNTYSGCVFIKDYFATVTEKFDLITFFHSLEHMPDQSLVFKKIFDSLNDGGVCVVALPIFPNYVWDLYGVNWVQLDAPRHFYLHSVKSLNILASDHSLRIKDIFYNSYEFQFMGSKVVSKGRSTKTSKGFIFSIVFFPYFLINKLYYRVFSNYLNKIKKGDQVVVVFEKM